MYLIMLGWIYVVGMIALTTAFHPQGSVLQAALVFLFVGVLPLGLLQYISGSGARRRRRQAEEAAQDGHACVPADTETSPNPQGETGPAP